jgi:hypothetical protein
VGGEAREPEDFYSVEEAAKVLKLTLEVDDVRKVNK